MAALSLPAFAPIAAAQSADYDFFKTRVQPIFLKTRATHGRCVTCHGGGNGGAFVLQPLARGATDWTEEQTMRNFAAASRLVQPGKPTSSQLLMHPLASDAGGDVFHSGGHQFASQDDPDWQQLAAWVRQKPPTDYTNLKVLKSGDHLSGRYAVLQSLFAGRLCVLPRGVRFLQRCPANQTDGPADDADDRGTQCKAGRREHYLLYMPPRRWKTKNRPSPLSGSEVPELKHRN